MGVPKLIMLAFYSYMSDTEPSDTCMHEGIHSVVLFGSTLSKWLFSGVLYFTNGCRK